jgi:glutamate 5-kinase
VLVVVKIGTSSVTTAAGEVDEAAVARLCGEVATLRTTGHDVVVVTSGAVTAGVAAMRLPSGRPSDAITLQALSGVGQHRLMRVYDDALGRHGLLAAQVLLAPLDFVHRAQYVHARRTLRRILELGVVPVVNENDAVADDEIRFSDNDRLAALVAHLLRAGLLVLLTDTPGLLSADPRVDPAATLVAEVRRGEMPAAAAGGPGSAGSGGMASKLAAATMAAWSGVRAVIAGAGRPGVLAAAVAGDPSVGTVFPPEDRHLSARKLWIAWALPPAGRVRVDAGARQALTERGTSLLPAGVTAVDGAFEPDDAIDIAGPDGDVFARGIARLPSSRAADWLGRRTTELPAGLAAELVHRDDLVLVASAAAPVRPAAREGGVGVVDEGETNDRPALFVATDEHGVDHHAADPVHWSLPAEEGGSAVAGDPVEGALELCTAEGLLGRLAARVSVAEVLDAAADPGAGAGGPGLVRAARARLVAPTAWDSFVAAGFALDCAERVLGDAAGVTLPDGTPLGDALARVREWLASAEAAESAGPIARLRDLAVGWRLRREGKQIGDAAFDAWVADTAADVDKLEDPVWTAVASARDAALAAVEAVQQAMFPHLSAYEAARYEKSERQGMFLPQAHDHPPAAWVPYWVAAADAAERARQAAAAAGGEGAEAAELAWQESRLAELLAGVAGT